MIRRPGSETGAGSDVVSGRLNGGIGVTVSELKRWGVGVTAVAALAVAMTTVPAVRRADAGPEPSGGRAVAHHAGGKVIAAPAVKAHAPQARLYSTGKNALEPTMGVTRKGDVFAVGVQGAGPVIVRSRNGGRSWEEVSPSVAGVRRHPITLDPYLYVDEGTGRVYTIDLTVACSYLSYTDDNGENWVTNPLACGRPVNDHQSLFSGPPVRSPTVGYPHIVYYCWNDIATSSCSKSLDGGITFSPTGEPAFHPVPLDEDDPGRGFCGGLHGHGVVGRDGTVYLPKEHCEQPWLGISTDEGATWNHVRVARRVAIFGPDPSVAVDAKNNLYYVYVGKDRLPYLAYSRNGGRSWSKPMMVGAPGLTEVALATLDADAPGKVAIAYYGTDDVSGKIDKRRYEDARWNFYLTMSADVFARDPVFYSASMNDPSDPVALRECGPRRCYDALDFIDVVVGPDGTPWTSFVDNCTLACSPTATETNGVIGRLVGGPKLR